MKCALLFLVTLGTALAQAPASWTPEFAMQFKTISSVTPSPDGSKVVWAQTQSVMDPDHSEMLTHLYLANADGTHRMQLTRGDKSATNPHFSPDGKSIFFQSARSGKSNVYRISIAGGEAEMITDFKGSLSGFEVSPDGKMVAFNGYEPPADEEKNKKAKRDFRVVDANPENESLYVIPVEAPAEGTRTAKKLTDGKRHVASGTWSPDSKSIAIAHWPSPGADNWTRSDVAEIDVATGSMKSIAATNAAEAQPIYSPDGKYLAYTRSADPAHWATDDRIVLVTRADGQSRTLPITYDEQPSFVGWTGDSKNLLFTENRRTQHVLFKIPVDGPPTIMFAPAKGTLGNVTLNARGNQLGMAIESTDEAPEAYAMAIGGSAPVRVSRANVDLGKPALGKTEVIRWKSKDGRDVEGLLTYPNDYTPGKKVPLILNIHGGPTGVFTETFIGKSSLYPIATFASRGYAVLRPNPRGSSGYGREFRFANYNDWGGMDYQDDQTGVDKVIAMGVADPDKLAVMGWSYGGFMTSWTITQTDRFKAAVIGAGVTDLWSFTGTADIPGFLPDYFGGEPWQKFETFQKHSPITYVKNVKTPTLVLHGEADVRVPTSQGYEYYHALKRQGTTAKMVVYPRQPHGPNEPKFVLDIMNRHLDWVDQYVK